MEQIKVAFLDRDGTIVKEYDDKDWIGRVEPELLENSIEGLKRISELGYKLIIITNQNLINKGDISWEDYKEFTRRMLKKLSDNGVEILDIFCCPHRQSENCNCIKPKPGMINDACKKYNINMEESFFTGDSKNDEGIANYFGLDFYAINFPTNIENGTTVKDLLEISQILAEKKFKKEKIKTKNSRI